MASRPPPVLPESRSSLPLLFPDRAALSAEIGAALSTRPRIRAPICLEPSAPGAAVAIAAPAGTFEGAQQFIHAAAQWMDGGGDLSLSISDGPSLVTEYFSQQVAFIEGRAQKEMARAFKAAGNKHTEAFATAAAQIRRNALFAIEKIDVPMSWFAIHTDETKFALREVERQEKRIVRSIELGAAKQAKDIRRAANRLIELPAGSTILGKWASRFGYLTIAIDVGPAFYKVITARDEEERKKARTAFSAELFGAGTSMAVGEATLALVLFLGPAGWLTLGFGVALSAGVSVLAGKRVKRMIDPAAD